MQYSPGKVAFKWMIVCLSMKLLSDHITALGNACEDCSWIGFHQKRRGGKSARVLRGSLLHLGNAENSLIGEQKKWKKHNRALCLMAQKLRGTSPRDTKQFQPDDSLIISAQMKAFLHQNKYQILLPCTATESGKLFQPSFKINLKQTSKRQ